jgi:hypothetical protein
MSDPYRTPAIVETREQRIERLYKVYCFWAMTNVANRTPEERERIDRGFQQAKDALLSAWRDR